MEQKKLIDWPFVIGLLLLPWVIVLIMFGVKFIQEYTRYDDTYFTEEYREIYDTPSSVAFALEGALREADEELMVELLATKKGPSPMEPRPSLIFVFLLDRSDPYLHYLYFNQSDYHRLIQYIKEVNGRYVAAEEDFYFYIDSGRWTDVAGPLILAWTILVIVATGMTFIYRYMARVRERRY